MNRWEYEYCVMFPRVNAVVPHRGPFDTYEEAREWIDVAESDGMRAGCFQVFWRPVYPWAPHPYDPQP